MLSSKSRKKNWTKKSKKRFCKELNPSLGCTICKYGPYTVIYGQKSQIRYRIYGVYTVIRFGPTLRFMFGNHLEPFTHRHTGTHRHRHTHSPANPIKLCTSTRALGVWLWTVPCKGQENTEYSTLQSTAQYSVQQFAKNGKIQSTAHLTARMTLACRLCSVGRVQRQCSVRYVCVFVRMFVHVFVHVFVRVRVCMFLWVWVWDCI
jgi:hypothetical protein